MTLELIVHNDKPLPPPPPPPPPTESELKAAAQQALMEASKFKPRKVLIIADVGDDSPEMWAYNLSRDEAMRMANYAIQVILRDL